MNLAVLCVAKALHSNQRGVYEYIKNNLTTVPFSLIKLWCMDDGGTQFCNFSFP